MDGNRNNRLTFGNMFGSIFKRHLTAEGARIFIAGTPVTTPPPERMIDEWKRPWLFTRVLAVGILFMLLAYIDVAALDKVYHGYSSSTFVLLSVGALIVPMSILIFYWEINIPRDIPIYRVLMIFFIGGMLSIMLLLFLGHYSITEGRAYLAPLTEEPAKIIAAALFIRIYNPRYIFGGLLIGAAVGAGFASFETVKYDFDYGFVALLQRSLLAIGGHIGWCAIESGALVHAKGGEHLSRKHFLSPKFLPYVAATMLMHFVWNSDIEFHRLQFGEVLTIDLKHIVLCCASIGLSFFLIRKAMDQVQEISDAAQRAQLIQRPEKIFPPSQIPRLIALSGALRGAEFLLERKITIGRDPKVCNIVFPPNTPNVSRKHCVLEMRADGVYIMDVGSSFGTFWQSGIRLPVNEWIKVRENFYLGTRETMFSVQ